MEEFGTCRASVLEGSDWSGQEMLLDCLGFLVVSWDSSSSMFWVNSKLLEKVQIKISMKVMQAYPLMCHG